MELNENLRNNLIKLRKDRSVTQDVLAAALDISVQAVSKWETGVSLPDIMQLPRIANFYGVSIDYLFYHEGEDQTVIHEELPDDGKLRIIQFLGNKMLDAQLWQKDKAIELKIPDTVYSRISCELHAEIWGNASISGDISGSVHSGGGINCGNIGGNADCGGSINSSSIGQNAESGGQIYCSDIGGNVECGGDINCNNIGGKVICEGDIHCHEIKGDVECEGDIIYENQKM